MRTNRSRAVLTAAAVVAIVAAAAAVVLYATAPRGPELTIDTTTYLLAAETYSVDRDHVSLVLNGVFPPGYPAAIALAGLVVDDAARASLVVNVVALMGTLLLVAGATWAAGRARDGRSPASFRTAVATVLTTAVVAGSSAMLRWSGAAMSELLSIACIVASVVTADRAIRRRSLPGFALAGAAAGAAALVRLVALGTLLGLAVAAVVACGGRWKERARAGSAIILAGGTTAVLGTSLLGGSRDSKRTIAWHPPGWEDARQGLDTVRTFLLPSSLGDAAGRALAAVVVTVALWGIAVLAVGTWRRRNPQVPPVALLAGLVGLAHIVVVLGSMALLDDLTPLDDRILLPVLPLAIVALGAAVAGSGRRMVGRVAAAVAVMVVAAQVGRVSEWVDGSRTEGMGFAHALFDDSEVLDAVRSMPRGTTVWSNDISLLYLRADRPSYQLPSKIDGYAGRASAFYHEHLEILGESLDQNAVIVYLDYVPTPNFPTPAELEDVIGPIEVTELPDGRIVRRAEPVGDSVSGGGS